MKKTVYILIVIALIVTLSYFFYDRSHRQAKAPAISDDQQGTQTVGDNSQSPVAADATASSTPIQSGTSDGTPSAPADYAPSKSTYDFGTETEISPDIQVWEVAYDGSGFVPDILDIRIGDIVIFQNQSSKAFRPVADNVAAYPAFDAGKSIGAGEKFQMQFLKAGAWGYHDQLNLAAKGTVNVTE